ncbi:MAG: Smr/MutS family protein [Myxococcota bacterium]|jgi:DNA mismatch repair protein MutS2|nr:Smr/MutS family protein [Myxococcota bacterium]
MQSITQKSLESLEWERVVALLLRHCRTPQARLRLGAAEPSGLGEAGSEQQQRSAAGNSPEEGGVPDTVGDPLARDEFEASLAGVRERLAETTEAREIVEAGSPPPLQGVADLRRALRRATMGGVLGADQLLDVQKSIMAVDALVRFVTARKEEAPRLFGLADTVSVERDVARQIDRCLEPSGEVRDSASPALREARRATSDLGAQLQRRLGRYLHDEDVVTALSDSYYTVRNDRYVLPVRADARGKVRGIVHDASRSGTTLFVEPEAVVELNNRLKQAEIDVAREVERVLRELSEAVAAIAPALGTALETASTLDLAFARAQLAIEMGASEPRVERDGCFRFEDLRHPLLPRDEAVPNDIAVGEHHSVLVISGPNGGGKTVAMKAVGLAAVMIRLGLHVPANAGARVDLFDRLLVELGDGQDMRESLSTFSAHMVNLAEVVQAAGTDTLALLDEVGVGTDPSEGAALAQAILEALADRDARAIATTHYNLLKEMAEVDERFCNASVEFDPETLAPTFRLHSGTAGASSATAVAARMGMPAEVLERANTLLEREDRRLDRMLAELGNSRAMLEREKQEATRLRAEGESARREYQHKLERLQERRDKLFEDMRADLDDRFKDAHAQVAAVIRGLQRAGEGSPRDAARGAAHARERLLNLEARARESAPAPEPEVAASHAVDWRKAKPGMPVLLPGDREGVLKSLPDRRGRVSVQVASAKLDIEATKVRERAVSKGAKQGRRERVRFEPEEATSDEGMVAGGSSECDLRGRRVDEALDELASALDAGLRDGDEILHVIHGIGTGALRAAVREHLHASPHVISHRPGERGEGGDGVTIAELRR